jgi:2-polyprenyl-3-methyl-5-hydroxy-6-metoxy-1,4-benzoquinol methylase
MDDPACDGERLRATYAQFAVVNRWLAGWRGVFERWLEPRAHPGATLLDVGCGGGDVARNLAAWSAAAGVPLAVTAVDPDARALAFARQQGVGVPVRYRQAAVEDLLANGERYDFVVSNHVLHHLDEAEVPAFLVATARLARVAALHNDLRRNALAWAAFAPLRPLFRGSFIVPDGLRSIRRAYRPDELRALAPEGWQVERMPPFRALLAYEAAGTEGAA